MTKTIGQELKCFENYDSTIYEDRHHMITTIMHHLGMVNTISS